MKYLLVVLLFLNSFLGRTQWNTMSTGTTSHIYSVDYFSSTLVWLGSFNRIQKSSNGGVSWVPKTPLIDLTAAPIQPANVNDLMMFSNLDALATGLYYTGNTEVILRTVNGATNWNQVSVNNSVPLLRYINSMDRWATSGTVVAVGNNGRIMRSIDQGQTWSLRPSGVTTLINDVMFGSPDTVYACATNNLLRSYDAGVTWTALSYAGDFANIDCESNVVFATPFSDSYLVKSVDFGQTFTTISLPFTALGALEVISKDTVIMAGSNGLYVTYNGGTVWEKYILTMTYKPVNMFDFLDQNNGIAVGNNGFGLKISNLSAAPSLPLVTYQIQGGITNYCAGDTAFLINTTPYDPSYSYQWQDNGVTFSTSYNANYITNAGGNHSIKLKVSNAFGADSVSNTIWVSGHDLLPFSLNVTEDTVCSGNYAGLIIPVSQTGVSYQLRLNSTILSTQSGNGGELLLGQGSGLTSDKNYNVKAVMSNTCFTDSIVMYQSIYVYPSNPNEPVPICIPSPNSCGSSATGPGITNFTFGGINNTTTHRLNHYFNYACCFNAEVVMEANYSFSITTNHSSGEFVKGWIDFNNDGAFHNTNELVFVGFANPTLTGTFSIDVTTVFNQPVRMRIKSSNDSNFSSSYNACSTSYCGEMEDYSVTILPAPVPPVSNFTSLSTVGCTTSVSFTSTSYNAISYTWDFGDGSPQVNTQNTSHVYSVSGNYPVTLITNNPYGSDTIIQMVNIVIPEVPIPAVCSPTIITTCSGRPYLNSIQFQGHVDGLSSGNRNYTCDIQYHLLADTTYEFFIGHGGSSYKLNPYLDANNDGVFSPSELLVPSGNIYNSPPSFPYYFNIPYNAVDSLPLRMRIFMSTTLLGSTQVCSTYCGDYKDFTVFIHHRPFDTDFSADVTDVCTLDSATINFQDSSVGAVSWLWDFGDGNTSNLQSPSHTYTNFGDYSVKLKIGDAYGHYDSLMMVNYISINEFLPEPVINVNAGLLSSSVVAASYLWYLNGNIISGADSISHQPLVNGFYSVDVISPEGCISSSDSFLVDLPEADFYADTLIYCNSDSAEVGFYNTSVNATDYFWDFGDGQISILHSPSHLYDSTGYYEVKLIVCNAFGCDTLLFSDYIIINDAPDVSVSPSILPVICGDTSIVLDADYYTSLNYQWQKNGVDIPSANDTIYTIQSSGNYHVLYEDTLGCTGISNSVTLMIDTTCVWPGDTDFDFTVNQYDLLPIGLFYGYTGTPRSAVDIDWLGHSAVDWNTQQASGSDIKHVDCNGDGIIDDADTLAVNMNFSETHNFSPIINDQRSSDPDLYCISSSLIYEAGEWVDIEVMAGTSAEQISDLYGIGFVLGYDNSMIEPGTSSLIFSDSWLTDNATDGLSMGKIFTSPSDSKIGLTRISHTGKNGFGKLATFRFQVVQNISVSTMMDFNVTEYIATDPNEINMDFDYNLIHTIELVPSTASVPVISSVMRNLRISPNPFNDRTNITFELEEKANIVLEVYNSIGQIISTLENDTKNPGMHNYMLSDEKNHLEAGIYFVKIIIDGNVSMQKVIKSN